MSNSSALTGPLPATAVIAFFMLVVAGCSGSGQSAKLTPDEIAQRLKEYDEHIASPQPAALNGLLHALASADPEVRAQAAVAFGKSQSVSEVVRERLEAMARSDESRLSQLAALGALKRLGSLSPELEDLSDHLGHQEEASGG